MKAEPGTLVSLDPRYCRERGRPAISDILTDCEALLRHRAPYWASQDHQI